MLLFTVYREGDWNLERECASHKATHLICNRIWIQIQLFFWFQTPCVSLHLSASHSCITPLYLHCISDLLGSHAISLSLCCTFVALRCCFKFHVYNNKWQREEKLKICHPVAAPSSKEEGCYLQRGCSCLTNCMWQESCCVRAFLKKSKTYWRTPSIQADGSQFTADLILLYVIDPPLFLIRDSC